MKMKDVILALGVAFVWGFNFVVIEVGLDSFPPLLFSALRFTCAALPAVLIWDRGDIAWRWIVSVGLSLGIVMFSLLFVGMKVGMPAGLASLVLQVQAVFTMILAGVLLKDRPGWLQCLGMVLALAGIALLATDRQGTMNFTGLALVVAAALAWAVANLIMKQSGARDMFRLIIWMSIIPPLPLLLLSSIVETGQVEALRSLNWSGVGAILYTGLISTVAAFAVWGRLLRTYSASVVAPFSLLVPVFGMSSAALVRQETFTRTGLGASALVLAGLVCTVGGARRSAAGGRMPATGADPDSPCTCCAEEVKSSSGRS